MKTKFFIPQIEKPLVSPDRLSGRDREMFKAVGIKAFPNRGMAGGKPLSPKPKRNAGSGDKIIEGETNASISITTDTPAGPTSGLGGQGIPTAVIDLCAGHMGAYARETDDAGEPVLCNPNFQIDSARVYIADYTNIDENMQLPDGKLGERKMSSAIGIMADDIAIWSKGEGGIKIAAYPTIRNSTTAGKNLKNPGIDLIVNDGEDQQPIPKGDNLIELLAAMSLEMDDLRGTLEQFVRMQGNFNDVLSMHNHNSPFYAQSTSPSFNVAYAGYLQMFQRVADVEKNFIFNIINKEVGAGANYFNPIAEKYILSGLVSAG